MGTGPRSARIDVIDGIMWFSSVGSGKPAELAGVPAESKERVLQDLESDRWESITLEASNRLSDWLHERHRAAYRSWNSIAQEAKAHIETTAIPSARALAEELGGGAVVLDNVRWDLVHVIVEASYADCQPPTFFDRLLEVYRAGRLPCGWDGPWPEGSLRYF